MSFVDEVSELKYLLPYSTSAQGDSFRELLPYAFCGIRDGNVEADEDSQDLKTEDVSAVPLQFEIFAKTESGDLFLFELDKENQLDKEGVRYSNMRGQHFMQDADSSIPLGKLQKVEYPKLTFLVDSESINSVRELVHNNSLNMLYPDVEDLTGEIEKVNRLRDSFDKITEHPEGLVNPKLSQYLFDASKATPTEVEKIEDRKNKIREHKLNTSLNESQIEAIAKAVEAQDLSVIQGPPGTGKSTAIAELIWQLALKKPNIRILLTSEANLAVDNALNRLKNSVHNIVKPVRIAAGNKFSAEGLSYSLPEMKKWAGVELDDIEKDDDALAKESDEYQNFRQEELVLCRWLINIYKRSTISDTNLRREWYDVLTNLPQQYRRVVLKEYLSHCNVIGATCSAISDTNYTSTELKGRHRDSRFIKKFRSVYKKGSIGNERLRFDVVIQDEASKATPAELSLPLIYGEKSVVIGDHRQLPPNLDKEDILFKLHLQRLKAQTREEHDKIKNLERYVSTNFAELEKSHFERLFTQIHPSLRGTFNLQYRMHPDINEVIRQFYTQDGGLECGFINEDYDADTNEWFSRYHGIDIPGLISPDTHILWINTNTPEIRDGSSRANKGEVEAVNWLLQQFLLSESFKKYLDRFTNEEDKEIGLISFYAAQLKRLRPIVNRMQNRGLNIKLSSVDRFQGMERNIIIVSLVRSNCIAQNWNQLPDVRSYGELGFPAQRSLGFAESPNRLNVALSRARRLLIIVGNSEHFCSYVNKQSGEAIYKNVFEIVKGKAGFLNWETLNPISETKPKIIAVPMPKNRSINLNTRDINVNTDVNLRVTETYLSRDEVPNPHFAVLELSTKAVKLLIGKDEQAIRESQTFSFDNFIRNADKTETGKGLNAQNEMDMAYFEGRVIPIIRKMKQIMRREGIDVVYSVATAAYRTAKNRDEIIATIKDKTGINVRILSKKEESIATMFAYCISSKYKLDIMKSSHSVMIDQGGGSTEVSVFNQGELIGSYSINLGTTALRNILAKDIDSSTPMSDALKKSDQMLKERLVAFFRNMGEAMTSEEEMFCVSVGTAITKATNKKNNASQHDTILTREMIAARIEQVSQKINEKLSTVSDLIDYETSIRSNESLDNAITMRVGLPMYLLLMDKFKISSIHVCGTGLWYGIYLQHLFNVAD